jgi:hypothetical protein
MEIGSMKTHKTVTKYGKFCLVGVLLLILSLATHADTKVANERTEQCSSGRYNGPMEGKKRFSQDLHTWFISAEFAKRFCMPTALIDPALKGALAIAVRIVPDQESLCGMWTGNNQNCKNYEELWLDIYVDNRTSNIPKADPTVKYYNARTKRQSFEMFWSDEVRSKQEYNLQYVRTDGKRRPFFPIPSKKDEGSELVTRFKYLGIRDGWASPESRGFIENYYEQDWRVGIDLIGLSSNDVGWGNFYDSQKYKDPYPNDPVRRYVIATAVGKDIRVPGEGRDSVINEYYRTQKLYPKVFTHTIEIPPRLADLLHQARARAGKANNQDLNEALPSGLRPAKP